MRNQALEKFAEISAAIEDPHDWMEVVAYI
jgi:hypothetical protein